MKRIGYHSAIVFYVAMAMSLTPMAWLFAQTGSGGDATQSAIASQETEKPKLETATFGGGCFWCVEAVYQRVNGVKSVVSGYAGGTVANPTYQAVSTGLTGHAEVCQITFDPSVVTFEEMLLIFFKTHDPTTLNQQGPDHGTQYRSVVFYDGYDQRNATEKMIVHLKEAKIITRKIVTEVSPLPDFYPAEAYHQNYFKLHPLASYCRNIIDPKVAKFEKLFKENSKRQKEREEKNEKKSANKQ